MTRRSRAAAPANTSRSGSDPATGRRSLLRNYSLSGPPDAGYYRISVKREPTAPPAAICTRRLKVGDGSTSPHHAAPSCSTGPTRRCC